MTWACTCADGRSAATSTSCMMSQRWRRGAALLRDALLQRTRSVTAAVRSSSLSVRRGPPFLLLHAAGPLRSSPSSGRRLPSPPWPSPTPSARSCCAGTAGPRRRLCAAWSHGETRARGWSGGREEIGLRFSPSSRFPPRVSDANEAISPPDLPTPRAKRPTCHRANRPDKKCKKNYRFQWLR